MAMVESEADKVARAERAAMYAAKKAAGLLGCRCRKAHSGPCADPRPLAAPSEERI